VPAGPGGSALLVVLAGARSCLRPLLVVLVPGAGQSAYAAGFGLGLAVQRAFIILPMRCSALALAWM